MAKVELSDRDIAAILGMVEDRKAALSIEIDGLDDLAQALLAHHRAEPVASGPRLDEMDRKMPGGLEPKTASDRR